MNLGVQKGVWVCYIVRGYFSASRMQTNLHVWTLINTADSAVIKKECKYTNCSALMKGSDKSGFAKTTCMTGIISNWLYQRCIATSAGFKAIYGRLLRNEKSRDNDTSVQSQLIRNEGSFERSSEGLDSHDKRWPRLVYNSCPRAWGLAQNEAHFILETMRTVYCCYKE